MNPLAGWVAPQYLEPLAAARLRRAYQAAKPTNHILLPGFFRPQPFSRLRKALERQPFTRKEADLFSFEQTPDLLQAPDPLIREFVALLQSREFTQLIVDLTGVKARPGKADAGGFRYRPGDHLLCHDDRLESRRVAYVVNFTAMSKRTGGALVFYASDPEGAPTPDAKRLYPSANSLSLFTVTPRSHHAVEEVRNGERLSITGWFHG